MTTLWTRSERLADKNVYYMGTCYEGSHAVLGYPACAGKPGRRMTGSMAWDRLVIRIKLSDTECQTRESRYLQSLS